MRIRINVKDFHTKKSTKGGKREELIDFYDSKIIGLPENGK